MTDVKSPAGDAIEPGQESARRSDENVAELRESSSEVARRAEDEAKNVLGAATAKCQAAASSANDYVKHRPWQAVGLAAGVGLLIGLLLNRK